MLTNLKARITNQPFNLLLVTAIFLFVFSFVSWGGSSTIYLHDTYLVIYTINFIWALSFLFFLVWTIYKLTSDIIWMRFLTWFHVLITIIILIVLLTFNFWYEKFFPPIKGDFLAIEKLEAERERDTKILLPIVILFLAGQFAFVVNIIGGLITKLWKR
jgi:hypothetical protein